MTLLLRAPGALGLRAPGALGLRAPPASTSTPEEPPPEPGELVYAWTIVSVSGGPSPTLVGANTLNVSFSYSTAGAVIVLRLTVTDPVSGFSASDDVVIRTVGVSTGTGPGWVDGIMTDTPPAGTATTELELVARAVGGANEPHFIGRLGWYGAYIQSEQWSPGGMAPGDLLITLEKRVIRTQGQQDDPDPFYEPVRHALRRAPDATGIVEEYDGEVPARKLTEYVATSSLPGTGGIPISITARSPAVRVTLPLETWFLGDVDNPDNIVPIKAERFSYRRSHAGSVVELPGQRFPAISRIGPASRSSRVGGELQLWVVDGRYNRIDLDAMLDAANVLYLRDPTGEIGIIYVAVLDEESWDLLRSPSTQYPDLIGDRYEASIPFVEVSKPPVVA